jgi:ABC-type polysaccharide/polyol phosphate transport system ATPase subunit
MTVDLTKKGDQSSVAAKHIMLSGVGVRYLLLSEDQRTFKGRVLNLLSSHPAESARFWALQGIDLEIRQGEIVGIIGRNGSGKSTLLRVISRIIKPTTGTVDVNGLVSPLLELGTAFNGELTGRENARLYGSIFKISREQMDEMIPKIIAFSELGTFFDIPIKTYSSGMGARLAFSVATQLQPDILLLDEVLSVGDEQFQKKCYFRIRKLIEGGSIVVLVSHSSSVIQEFCNRAVYLAQGKLVADGKPHAVINRYHQETTAAG